MIHLTPMRKSSLNVGILGATGMVGREFLVLLEKRGFPVGQLRLFASSRSAGQSVLFDQHQLVVEDIATADPAGLNVAFFSAGSQISLKQAPRFTDAGVTVIDNSSAFREDPEFPLIIPEVNGFLLKQTKAKIIANPNCSTIILLLPLAVLHRIYGLSEVIVSTYQAVSGAGKTALDDLFGQARSWAKGESESCNFYDRPIFLNLIPQIGDWTPGGDCLEEDKIVRESWRILDDSSFPIFPTTVRVPVERCHSESVFVRLKQPATVEEIAHHLADAPGIALSDLPTPREMAGQEDVYVGRIRMTEADKRIVRFWVVSDQLWKGAALNAIQIAETMIKYGSLG